MKHLISTLFSVAATITGSAAGNMWLVLSSANQLQIGHTPGTESYVLYTTGTDPYVSMSNLTADLTDDETVLTFEYMASNPTGHIELFFHYPARAGVSKVYTGLAATGTWTTVSLDISEPRKSFAWGALGDQLRIDFGNVSGNTITVRNIRISTPDGGDYTPRDNAFSLEAVKALGLPVLEINTVDGEEPTCDYVSPPDGSIGAGIANATKVPGSVTLTAADGTVIYKSGDYVKGSSGMTVKIRGNTSAYPPKKPYKIKLQKKGDMLGLGKAYADKNWVLIKDESQLMRNGFKMGELTDQQWAPRWMYVNVVFNGTFRGFYLLCESVERNTSCRLNVADDGFIAELDAYWWNEDGAYFNSVEAPIRNYTLKYPDYEDLTGNQPTLIQKYLTQFEQSIPQGTYPNYIDVASFAGWLVAHDILGTLDSAGSNMLVTRYDLNEDTKIRMGNLWDFDSTESMTNAWSNVHTHNFTKYFNSPNKLFAGEYVRAYQRVKDTVYDGMIAFVSEFAASDQAVPFERSLNLDNELWSYNNQSGMYSTKRSISWYTTRKAWMDSAVKTLAVSSGLDTVGVDAGVVVSVIGRTVVADGAVSVYDTTGRRVAEGVDSVTLPDSGLYLVVTGAGSRKVVVK